MEGIWQPRVASLLVCGVTADVTELSADSETHLITWSRPPWEEILWLTLSARNEPQMGTRPRTFDIPGGFTPVRGSYLCAGSPYGQKI